MLSGSPLNRYQGKKILAMTTACCLDAAVGGDVVTPTQIRCQEAWVHHYR
jgi:hypothetical protein